MKRPRVLTWHIHGSYLWYLSHCPADFLLPVLPNRPHGYQGRSGFFPWPENVVEVPAHELRSANFDVILYQSPGPYLRDQHELLSPRQRALPRIYLEHDPPRESPTDSRHLVDDPETTVVHVTPFNALMWDCGRSPVRVVEHGVTIPRATSATLELDRGITVVNNLFTRGRRLGPDVFEHAASEVAIDLVGMGSLEHGGLGEVPLGELPAFIGRYRFFFNPIRYTSLGLAVCEAMMAGLPVVGLATTEMATAVRHGVTGFTSNDPATLIDCMRALMADRELALRLGGAARETARDRFGIERFCRDWMSVFEEAVDRGRPEPLEAAGSVAR